MNKEGSLLPIFVIAVITILIGICWDTVPAVKENVHNILDPSFGILLNWNLTVGMLLIVYLITLITTVVQKYTTDQKALKELKEEQKSLSEEMQKYRDNPNKIMELNKKSMELFPKQFKLTSRSILYTSIPFILFFRWFTEFFTSLGNPKFFGFITWFWFYMIFSVIFSIILRKMMKMD